MPLNIPKHQQRGLSLVELVVAMALGLLVVAWVSTVYLNTARHQRALERKSASLEVGAFALRMLGRDILNAGFYPASFSSDGGDVTQQGMYDSYPPLQFTPRKPTDWQNTAAGWPPQAYMTGVYGCDGGEFNVQTATCPASDSSKSDSIVINYFTADAMGDGIGRKDCTGSAVDNDPSNKSRINAGKKLNQPPLLPLFISNRYALRDVKHFIDHQDVPSKSLACSGNGMSAFGSLAIYQPIVSGFKEMRFRYGVYSNEASSSPDKFYTASEVGALPVANIGGQSHTGWQRVTAVKVCLLSHSLGGGVRLEESLAQEMQYLDCNEQRVKLPAGQWVHRWVQVFGVRNALQQSY